VSQRIKYATIHFQEGRQGDDIHIEGFPAQAFTISDGAIRIERPNGITVVPITDNLRKVEFDK
jgi:hypothetical protein